MRILISGGAGFIGSNIVDAYIHAGHEVAVIDNLSTGLWANLHPQATFFHVDIRNAEDIARVFAKFHPQIVNHHAAQIDVRKSTEDPVGDAEINILGSMNLLKAAVAAQIEKFIYASSGGAVYGEPEYLPADEKHPIHPISEYGVSKYVFEQYLHVYDINYGLNYTILRYANVYGPRQNVHGEAGVIAVFIGKILAGKQPTIFGTGTATRDYVFVGDVVRANLLALTHGDNMTVNIGTRVETSVNTVYHEVAEKLGFTQPPLYAPRRVGEIERTYLDNQFALRTLEWQPETSLNDGIQRTIDYINVAA